MLSRVESNIQRAISEILEFDVQDSKIGFITITAVKLQSDYSYVTIYYTLLSDNNDDRLRVAKDHLEHAKSFIRGKLSKKVQMRKTPELEFKYDDSLTYGNKIESVLKDIKDQKE